MGKEVKVKAAGGISSFDDAEEFIRLGAERLGTSRLVKIMKNSHGCREWILRGDGVSTHMMVELVGYIGSMLVLISFLMTSVVKLRIINAVGGTIFAVYAMIIQSYPTALMNAAW